MRTCQEITMLRRNGRLNDALEAAEELFAFNNTIYTANALFWCLNDLSKQNPDPEIFVRMRGLRDKFAPDDELMAKALDYLEARLDPIGTELRNTLEIAKNGGNPVAEYRKIQSCFDNGSLKHGAYPDLGWLIYYILKHTPLYDAFTRKVLLNNYFKLDLPKPSILHSLFLAEAIQLEKDKPLDFRIRDFMTLWGWKNFRKEDWERFESENGHLSTSSVEKLISVYSKELMTDHVAASDEFERLVDEAITRFPDSQNLPLHKARVLLSRGRKHEAIEYYRDMIHKSPVKSFLWVQLASLVDDLDIKIGLLSKAVNLQRNEDFLGNVRLNLAEALIQKGLAANARYELNAHQQHYAKKKWHLKPEYQRLERRVGNIEATLDNKPLYAEYIPKADNFIYESLPVKIMVKAFESQIIDRRNAGRSFTQWTLRTDKRDYWLKNPGRLGVSANCPDGTIFETKVKDGKIVWIRVAPKDTVLPDWIKK